MPSRIGLTPAALSYTDAQKMKRERTSMHELASETADLERGRGNAV